MSSSCMCVFVCVWWPLSSLCHVCVCFMLMVFELGIRHPNQFFISHNISIDLLYYFIHYVYSISKRNLHYACTPLSQIRNDSVGDDLVFFFRRQFAAMNNYLVVNSNVFFSTTQHTRTRRDSNSNLLVREKTSYQLSCASSYNT